jgi:hypothetical protein
MTSSRTQERGSAQDGEQGLNIRWDDSAMRSAYANVCHVNGNREEIILLFGMHKSWSNTQREVVVQLLDRVVLNPYAAKRLSTLLARVLREYEARYGQIQTEAGDHARPAETLPTG